MNLAEATGIIAVADAAVRDSIRRSAETIPSLRVVGEAKDGRQAISLLVKHAPDIAVLDVLMPLASGKEVLEEIQRRNLKTRVLLTTAHDCADYLVPAFWSDALGYLYRGDGLEDWIVPALKTLIAGRHFVSPTPLEVLRSQCASSSKPIPPLA